MGEMLSRSVEKIGATIQANPGGIRDALGVPSMEELGAQAQALTEAEQARQSAEQSQDAKLQANTDAILTEREERIGTDEALQGQINNFQATPGPQGIRGEKGPKGEAGAIGAVGPKGDTGAQGAIGLTGPAGTQGVSGLKGDAGAAGPQGFKGDTGATGAAGTNATTTAVVTTTANGLMSAADKTKLNGLGITTIRTATQPIPLLLAGISTDLTFTFATVFPSTTYSFNYCTLGAISLGAISVVEKSRTASSITLTVKNTSLISLAVGSNIIVTAFTES